MSNRSSCITNQDIKILLGNTNYDVDKIMEEVGLHAESTINFEQVHHYLLHFFVHFFCIKKAPCDAVNGGSSYVYLYHSRTFQLSY